jgi:hypothetical protein
LKSWLVTQFASVKLGGGHIKNFVIGMPRFCPRRAKFRKDMTFQKEEARVAAGAMPYGLGRTHTAGPQSPSSLDFVFRTLSSK